MLLLYQVGSVKIGEVVRYTVTYTPSHDRILPSAESLQLRIRNTCAIALRAAFVHGPYTLSVAAYPSTFNPNEKFANPRRYGVPEFEPMLKAGGTWNCHLVVPDDIRQSAGTGKHGGSGYFGGGGGPEHGEHAHEGGSVSWVIEVASQVVFSTSAAVNYEILLARDEKSLSLSSGVPVIGGQAQVPLPGRLGDYHQSVVAGKDQGAAAPAAPAKGVFSRAIRLKVEDTASLWNTPQLPGWDDAHCLGGRPRGSDGPVQRVATQAKVERFEGTPGKEKQKKIHLVVLTHGLHGNMGSDMLFLKESIDAGVRQAKKDAKVRKAKERAAAEQEREAGTAAARDGGDGAAVGADPEKVENRGGKVDENNDDDDDDDDDEEVIVRGFSGNATRTERGIKYLGKRLARFVLSTTYPDQPYLPTAKATPEVASHTLKTAGHKHDAEGKPAHKHSTIHKAPVEGHRLYKITKISFVAHSLGGLVQTYAIAYIQKHSPLFFDLIEPINFIAMASPFLGLNHENPLYVKFALDFGLVGRTGQDLGLTWRAPTIARNGWGAIVSNLGENAHKHVYGEAQPESKPLLRILPTGPAHIALKKFRNRTLYSNVVNDGIVPLRTSCLLFLDWQGLGRVEKARREAGLVETVVRSGWAELTGANVTTARTSPWVPAEGDHGDEGLPGAPGAGASEVPQPPTNATLEDDRQSLRAAKIAHHDSGPPPSPGIDYSASTNNSNPFTGLFNLFRSHDGPKPSPASAPKQNKILQRSQTLKFDDSAVTSSRSSSSSKSKVTTGHELTVDESEGVSAPPTTTFFESAGDVLNPTLPTVEFLIDPSKRPRAIFHDRIYHPSDIPPAPLKRRPTVLSLRQKSFTSGNKSTDSRNSSPYSSSNIPHQDSSLSKRDYDDTEHTNPDMGPDEEVDSSQMRVEEKIARAYHRGLSWRKVLVKLEPDAHNNMVVRRMFANAFGWPVIHHLVEAHFSDSAAARTPDDEETNDERARHPAEAPDEHGAETTTETAGKQEDASGSGSDSGGGTGAAVPAVPAERGRPEQDPAPAEGPGSDPSVQRLKSAQRTVSEDREATDTVSDLPQSPDPQQPASPQQQQQQQQCDVSDSVTWSDRDWVDSAAESEDADLESTAREKRDKAKARGKGRGNGAEQSPSPSPGPGLSPLGGAWSWTEKIVGKGTGGQPKSPQSQGAGVGG